MSKDSKPNVPELTDSGRGNSGDPQHAAASMTDASERLSQLQQQINRLQRTVRQTIEAELVKFSGQSFGALTANQAVVIMIQEMLEAHGLRVRCPECGHPAILRCSGRPGVAHGVFVLDHTIEGRRTFHGGYSLLPEFRLIAKPPRRTAKKAS